MPTVHVVVPSGRGVRSFFGYIVTGIGERIGCGRGLARWFHWGMRGVKLRPTAGSVSRQRRISLRRVRCRSRRLLSGYLFAGTGELGWGDGRLTWQFLMQCVGLRLLREVLRRLFPDLRVRCHHMDISDRGGQSAALSASELTKNSYQNRDILEGLVPHQHDARCCTVLRLRDVENRLQTCESS